MRCLARAGQLVERRRSHAKKFSLTSLQVKGAQSAPVTFGDNIRRSRRLRSFPQPKNTTTLYARASYGGVPSPRLASAVRVASFQGVKHG